MKRFFLSMLTAVMAIAFVGCEYDDSELTGRVENLEGRVQTLEQLCQQMNTNITAMQAIINALQTQDAITAVTPITEGGKVIGYTITFVKGDPITIYHGQDGANGKDGADGEDGYTPVIGVAQAEDGEYYWTLDGEWLTDTEGNKIPTSGADGADGADGEDGTAGNSGMPQLKIQGGYWYVSYDGGETWERLGRATGYDGQDGKDGATGAKGDSFFKNVREDENFVYFTLVGGNEFKVPKFVELTITFDQQQTTLEVYNGEMIDTSFTINDKDADYVVICNYPYVSVDSHPSNVTEITVTLPIPYDAEPNDKIKITVVATRNGYTAMATREFIVKAVDTNYIENFIATNGGGKIVLNQDVVLSTGFEIPASSQVEINLNGNDLSIAQGNAIVNKGKLEIRGEGNISSGDTYGIINEAGAKLTIDGDLTINAIENKGGTLDVKSATINSTNSAVSGIQSTGGNVTLGNDVNVSSARHALRIEGGNVTINGGTYEAGNTTTVKSQHALNVGGESTTATVTINGGKFIGPKNNTSSASNHNGVAVMVQKNGTVTINGGEFLDKKGASYKVVQTIKTNVGTLTIKGGTYDEEPSSSYIADGYTATKNSSNNTWTVK